MTEVSIALASPLTVAPIVVLLVQYLRAALRRWFVIDDAAAAPALAILAGVAFMLAMTLLGFTAPGQSWRESTWIGVQAAVGAMGGYSALKALVDARQPVAVHDRSRNHARA